MSSPTRLDHAVILVADLERAIADYSELGFTVVPGGEHTAGRTRNALIAFADGSYLELLAYTRRTLWRVLPWLRMLRLLRAVAERRAGLERRFLLRSGRGEGLIDFALHSDALESDLARIRAMGVEVEGPLRGGRVRPDGEEVDWELGIPRLPDMPFLCVDRTPRALRVPSGSAREHANGVTGVAGVTVAVPNLETSSARYRVLLATDPQSPTANPQAGSRARVFPLGSAQVTLLAPAGMSPLLRGHLRRHGPGPYSLQLRYPSDFPSHTLDPMRTHGVRIELVPR